jgi:general secretion pathway protein L
MKETLYIRLSDGALGAPGVVAWHLAAGRASQGHSPLAELAPRAQGRRAVVFVPGNQVLLANPRLPTRKRQRMLQALPFALEEQLASDVDGLHFALGTERADGSVAAAAVAHERMDGWLADLHQAGIEPELLVADCDALHASRDRWTLLVEADHWLLRTPSAGYVFDADAGPDAMALALAEAGDAAPATLRLIDARGGDGETLPVPLADALPEGVQLVPEPLRGGVVGLLAPGADGAVNLLQGPYGRREALSRRWRPWRPAAAMLGAVLLLWAGLSFDSYRTLRSEQARLDGEIVAIYRDAFPDAQRVVDARAQMEQRLAALRGAGGQSGLAALLEPVAPVFKGTAGLAIQGLRYRENNLEVDLTLGDLQALDGLKQALLAAGPLQVEIASASAKEGRVEGRLTIQGGGA